MMPDNHLRGRRRSLPHQQTPRHTPFRTKLPCSTLISSQHGIHLATTALQFDASTMMEAFVAETFRMWGERATTAEAERDSLKKETDKLRDERATLQKKIEELSQTVDRLSEDLEDTRRRVSEKISRSNAYLQFLINPVLC